MNEETELQHRALPVVDGYTAIYRRTFPTDQDMRDFAAKMEPVPIPAEALRIIEANFWSLLSPPPLPTGEKVTYADLDMIFGTDDELRAQMSQP